MKTGKQPIILVDDVLLELDHEKRNRFLEMIDGYDQVFFTFLPQEQYFSVIPSMESIIYTVKEGRFGNYG
jgi:DNA replication and repair protein RecF